MVRLWFGLLTFLREVRGENSIYSIFTLLQNILGTKNFGTIPGISSIYGTIATIAAPPVRVGLLIHTAIIHQSDSHQLASLRYQ